MSRLEDIAAERAGKQPSDGRFVAWYRGPRGGAVKCLVLGFNAGVMIPVEPAPVAMATALITAFIVTTTLRRPLERCTCPGVQRTGCSCSRCHGTGWYPDSETQEQADQGDYREAYCDCAAGDALRKRDRG